jgi:hypothetical protein
LNPLFNKRLVIIAMVLVALSANSAWCATVDRYWEVTPYRLRVVVVVDLPSVDAQLLETRVQEHIANRFEATLGALVRLDFQPPAAPSSHAALSPPIGQLVDDDELAKFDKVMLVKIDKTLGHYRIRAQEFDNYMGAWGQPAEFRASQLGMVPEYGYRGLLRVFSPLATYTTRRGDDAGIDLSFKGSALPRRSNIELVPVGSLMAPFLRRIDSTGRTAENGVDRVKWTYLEVDRNEGTTASATVISHTKRPFGFRQRGRVEQLAIFVRDDPQPVTLRLYNRIRETEGLANLDVYLQNAGETATRLLGKTDERGKIEVPPGPTRVQTAFVKSGAVVLAKIPLVPGDIDLVEAPLPDPRPRLAAEAKLAAIREDLIDVVARRSIMAARIDRYVDEGNLELARQVLSEFDNLPGRSQFATRLDREQRIKIDDPVVQKQVDRLFDDTRGLLSRFLDAGMSTELSRKITAAQTSGP